MVRRVRRQRGSALIDPGSIEALQAELKGAISGDRRVLDELREDVRPLREATRRSIRGPPRLFR